MSVPPPATGGSRGETPRRVSFRALAPADALLAFRDEFPILARTNYLVSNSLGAMPRGVPGRLADYAEAWAGHGVRAWARGWWAMPATAGDAIAPLIGAAPRGRGDGA